MLLLRKTVHSLLANSFPALALILIIGNIGILHTLVVLRGWKFHALNAVAGLDAFVGASVRAGGENEEES